MLSSFDRDPSERACFTQRWAKLAHRLADCSASMSDGSDSDRDNEPLSALTAKQGKGKSKVVVDSSYDKADAFYPGVHIPSDWISCLLLGKVWNVLGDRRRSQKIDFDIRSTR